MFPSIEIDSDIVKQRLDSQRSYRASIKDLLMSKSTSIQTSRMRRLEFYHCLNLMPSEAEAARSFSLQVLELLRQVRAEQAKAPESARWRECTVVSTILFNTTVSKLDDQKSSLGRRSYHSIESQVAWMRHKKAQSATTGTVPDDATAASEKSMFHFQHDEPVSELVSPSEKAFAQELFSAIRSTTWTKNKEKFCSLFDFGAHVCSGVTRKPDEVLNKLWGSLKRADNRDRS